MRLLMILWNAFPWGSSEGIFSNGWVGGWVEYKYKRIRHIIFDILCKYVFSHMHVAMWLITLSVPLIGSSPSDIYCNVDTTNALQKHVSLSTYVGHPCDRKLLFLGKQLTSIGHCHHQTIHVSQGATCFPFIPLQSESVLEWISGFRFKTSPLWKRNSGS